MELKKSFYKYFYEFIVLFIAVFMGFAAENFRENISENQKESMLMKSLLNDLKTDSIQLQEIIEANTRKSEALGSFIEIRNLDFNQKTNLYLFYDSWKPIGMWSAINFDPTKATLNQLKSTGALSSIEPTLAAAIALYDVSLEKNKFEAANYYKHTEETFRMIYDMTDYIAIWNDPPETPPLHCDKTYIMKFFNLSADLMWTIDGYIETLENISQQINELIVSIEIEYD